MSEKEKIEKKETPEVKNNVQEADFAVEKRNPWMIAAVLLGIAFLVALFFAFKGGATGNVISGADAGKALASFLNEQTGGGVEYVSSSDKGNVYEVTVSYKNQSVPVYVTKDGQYFIQSLIPIKSQSTDSESETPEEVPKSDKPVAEAFVFSYCPYGLQFEKALSPVYNLLKNKADIKIVFIGAMHGQYEKTESLRQLCIEKNYGRDKLFAYLDKFNADTAIGTCGDKTDCSKPLVDKLMTGMGIDKTKIETCMAKDAEALYSADEERANSLGISGSPTFVINGVSVNVGRNPEAIKQAICSAFTTAPSECTQTLSTTSASAGFGGGSGASTGATC